MNKRRVVLAAAAWLAVSPLARADVVIKVEGQAMGDVVRTSATEVTLQTRGSSTSTKDEPGTGSPPMPTIVLQPKSAWAISLPIW